MYHRILFIIPAVLLVFLFAAYGEAPAGTFSGDQSAGIDVSAPPPAIEVYGLTTDITPEPGVAAVSLTGTGESGKPGDRDTDPSGDGSDGDGGPGLSVVFDGGSRNIATQGDEAYGIHVMSKAGNGGPGADADDEFGVLSGGGGGSGGDGGDVAVDSGGAIATAGDDAHGIAGHSFGGHGNVGGEGFSWLQDEPGPLFPEAPGGDGGNGGVGGEVTIVNSASIATQGDGAHGIHALSQGGDGAQGGDADALDDGVVSGNGGDGGDGGHGGHVSVSGSGSITTHGTGSHGILAESLGGRGGAGGRGDTPFTGRTGTHGSGGAVDVIHSGDIAAHGRDADGIRVRSVGPGGASDMAVTLENGSVTGGSGHGAGVRFVGGDANRLVNHGKISALSDLALAGGTGDETVDNHGIITGSTDTGSGTDRINNHRGAVFNTGAAITLGPGSTFHNAGTVSPGGSGAPENTHLTGNFEQAADGVLEAEVFTDGRHDRLSISGGSAAFDGELRVIREPGLYSDGTSYTVINAKDADAVEGSFSTITAPEPKPLIRFNIHEGQSNVIVEIDAPSHTTVATNRVQMATARHLDEIAPDASGDLFHVLGEFQQLHLPDIETAFPGMSPDSYDNYTRTAHRAGRELNRQFHGRMDAVRTTFLHAPTPPHDRPRLDYDSPPTDIDRLYTPGQPPHMAQLQGREGFWIDTFGSWAEQKAKHGYTGYDQDSRGGMLGFDILKENWLIGLGAGVSRTELDLENRQGDGRVRNFSGGLYGSYFRQRLFIDSALTFGKNRYKTKRNITIGQIERQAESEYDGKVMSASLGGGYTLDMNGWGIEPFGTARYVYLEEDGFRESGADSVDLNVDSRYTDSLISDLGFRVFRAWKVRNGYFIPEISAAWRYDFDLDDRKISASYAGAPDTFFTVPGQDVDRHGAAVSAGFSYGGQRGLSAALHYHGEFRDNYTSNGVSGKLQFRF